MRGVLIALVVLAGCGLPADIVTEVRQGRAGAKAVMDDGRLDKLARQAGEACYDYSWAILYATGDEDEIPEDVRARREARQLESRAAAPQ